MPVPVPLRFHSVFQLVTNRECSSTQVKTSVRTAFVLLPTAEGPSNYLSSSSGHFVNLLLGCTSGLNLAADLGPVLVLLPSVS